MNWWPRYRAAWCYNLLGEPDSACIFAEAALDLSPGSERCLAELLKSLSDNPDAVLQYQDLVSGGGVCRYRLARAELQLDMVAGSSVQWLLQEYSTGDSLSAADAGCWLSMLFPPRRLECIRQSVAYAPEERFYRYLLIDALISSDSVQEAVDQFILLDDRDSSDFHYWQTAAAVYKATGLPEAELDAARTAFQLRQTPSSGADLGWRLYFQGRALLEQNQFQEATLLLRESSETWNSDSSWAERSDSLINLINQFTSVDNGYGEPL